MVFLYNLGKSIVDEVTLLLQESLTLRQVGRVRTIPMLMPTDRATLLTISGKKYPPQGGVVLVIALVRTGARIWSRQRVFCNVLSIVFNGRYRKIERSHWSPRLIVASPMGQRGIKGKIKVAVAFTRIYFRGNWLDYYGQ